MDKLYRAEIRDDNGDVTFGPAESYKEAASRLSDALTDHRNLGGDIKEVE